MLDNKTLQQLEVIFWQEEMADAIVKYYGTLAKEPRKKHKLTGEAISGLIEFCVNESQLIAGKMID